MPNTGAEINLAASMPPVRANRTALGQVIANLINNAIKFVEPQQRPTIRLSTELRDERVRLWVEDEGIGIAPEHQDRIFQPFERLHGGDHYRGTGIGLGIVA